MMGYGYTRIRGRAAITTDVVGGYSFNSFHLDPVASADYQQRLGSSVIGSSVTNASCSVRAAGNWPEKA